MANRFGPAGQIIPFWKRALEKYPLWQKGDPQLRILLPTFWMKIVKPPEEVPNNQVYFVTHPQMTKHDIKNYLEKIYNVPVAEVRTIIKMTPNTEPGRTLEEAVLMSKHDVDPIRDKQSQSIKWSEEYKQAIVTLGEGQTFKYPDLESVFPMNELMSKYEKMAEKNKEMAKKEGVPQWFR